MILYAGLLLATAAHSAELNGTAVIDILRSGSAADSRGDGKALMRAGLALERMGVRPAAGETDIGQIWFAKAKALGVKIPTVPHYRGRTLGPAYRRGIIAAHGTFITQQSVNAGESAVINIMAVKGAELGLDITDDDNHQICHLTHDTLMRGCHWVPVYTGMNALTINNSSDFSDSYFIVIN